VAWHAILPVRIACPGVAIVEGTVTEFDAIVVGARCAGSVTAMLLARKGYNVLLVDRGSFPSDTLSTHYIHQPGTARLHRWGLLRRLAATGCPPIRRLTIDVGPFALTGEPQSVDGIAEGFAPRRTVLDKLLVDAAVEAGVELRERFQVTDLVRDGGRVVGVRGRTEGGGDVEERGRVVVGADGAHSVVAARVDAPTYEERPAYSCAYYTYWSGVKADDAELYPRPGMTFIVGPTHDDLILAIAYWPESEFDKVRRDVESRFLEAADQVPTLAARLRAGRRAEKFRGTRDLQGFFRRPFGPGWALVGDAGYHKNPITAFGITDAFRDAELLADALHATLGGRTPWEAALGSYERARNEVAMPLYQLTADLAKLEPPPPEMQSLMAAVRGRPAEISRFFGTFTGAVPIPEYFAPENVQRVLAGA